MTIGAILRIIIFALAGLTLLFALRSLLAGMRSRTNVNKQYFNVGKLEAQRQVFASMLSTVGLVVVAIILALVAAAVPDDLFGSVGETLEVETSPSVIEVDEVAQAPEVEAPVEASGETESGAMVAPEVENSEGAEPEPAEAETVVEPTAIPTETAVPTPELKTLYVNSPIVGLYIRDLPEGDIIDVLDDQTELGLLAEGDEINGIRWIQVQTNDGREGWVAEQFTTEVPPLVPITSETDS